MNARFIFDVDAHSANAAISRMITLTSPAFFAWFLEVDVKDYIRDRARDRFFEEGDDASGSWAPLMPSTIEIRESEGFGGSGPINVRTGELENWVTESQASIVPTGDGAYMKYPGTAPRGELRKKVITAQKGKVGTRRSTVPRPVLAVNETDLLYAMTKLMMYYNTSAVVI